LSWRVYFFTAMFDVTIFIVQFLFPLHYKVRRDRQLLIDYVISGIRTE